MKRKDSVVVGDKSDKVVKGIKSDMSQRGIGIRGNKFLQEYLQ